MGACSRNITPQVLLGTLHHLTQELNFKCNVVLTLQLAVVNRWTSAVLSSSIVCPVFYKRYLATSAGKG